MIEGLTKLRCGNCECAKHYIYSKNGNKDNLYIECIECKSLTIVTFTRPEIKLEFGPDSEGRITKF